MADHNHIDFCTVCRKNTVYTLQKVDIIRNIRSSAYTFTITAAVCTECGETMSIPGLIDTNVQEIDAQYREAEGLVSVRDIENLMQIYQIGKAPLSLALGFGEITITRYLEGQIPSKAYSDVIRSALTSPAFMKRMLEENRDKLTDAAYRKAVASAEGLEERFSVSAKMLGTVSYLFGRLEELTPLTLQTLLYFVQGVHSALYGRPLFPEDCSAWIRGPVFPAVHKLFRDFTFDPADDARFALLDGAEAVLTDGEKRVISLVTDTFGLYGGKALEKITHGESPWTEARSGYGGGIPSGEILQKERIMAYYQAVNRQYGIDTEAGLQNYIRDMLGKAS